MTVLTTPLYVVALAGALFAAPDNGSARGLRRLRATWVAVVVVGVPTLLQFTVVPGLLVALQRNWVLIGAGQWWRTASALVVQDGAVAGALFNLVTLVLVGVVAERAFGVRSWVLLFVVAGIGAQFWGALVQPVGAGNSVAVFGLAAASEVFVLIHGRRAARVVAGVGLAAGLALLVLGDLHGGAVFLGAFVALLLICVTARRQRAAPLGHQR